jgi:hypothetical protein
MTRSRYLENEAVHISANRVLGTDSVHKFGAVPAMSQGATGTIWDKNDTPYPWSAFDTPGILTVQTTTANGSASTADSGKSITIIGLDENFLPTQETIAVSGSTGTGTQTFARVYRAYTSDTNAAQFRVSRDGTEVLRVSIGKSQTLMAIYTVPAGKVGFLIKGTASVQDGADATVDMFVRYSGSGPFRIGHSLEVSGAGGQYLYEFAAPPRLPEKTDIDIEATVRSNNARITGAFDIILLDKNLAGKAT